MNYSTMAVSCLLGLLNTATPSVKGADIDYNHDKHYAFNRHLLYSEHQRRHNGAIDQV
jgi:hypothetical protein